MSDYTPTTEEVRQQWGWNYPDYDNTQEQFDRWLDEVKAQAWQEGWDTKPPYQEINNPYRGENK